MTKGDDIDKFAKAKLIPQRIDQFINCHVKQENNSIWSCMLPSLDFMTKQCKMFQGKDFTLKHVRTKHQKDLFQFRRNTEEKMFRENYTSFHEEQKEQKKNEFKILKHASSRRRRDLGIPFGLPIAAL